MWKREVSTNVEEDHDDVNEIDILGFCKARWTKRGGVNWAFFKI
jgi:hypothetical protein